MRNLVKGALVFATAMSLSSYALATGKEKAKKADKKGAKAQSCFVCKDEPAAGAEGANAAAGAECANKEWVKAKTEDACKKQNGTWVGEAAKK